MTEKEKIIKEMCNMPTKYGVYKTLLKDGKWDVEKLKYLDLHELKSMLRDYKTFERNINIQNGTD